jgi:hypothetical protein
MPDCGEQDGLTSEVLPQRYYPVLLSQELPEPHVRKILGKILREEEEAKKTEKGS